ncbi:MULTISPECIES: VWA domain-containing protein [Paraburkholderia]|uniref:VWA domain-containing protein n=1 Tax=Paraburkholderia phenoliruptrix TaxID=252970 RepID=UPI001C6E3B28|nr:VWA domain-containing protein [Paraburkholderia phenoliruptrix]MBW9131954.1 VWA domain-containing protein [Paraburkholderia ginsengiterrae]
MTDLRSAARHRFGRGDIDELLLRANAAIDDFAGGTRIGGSPGELPKRYPHRSVGERTVVLIITGGLETGRSCVGPFLR